MDAADDSAAVADEPGAVIRCPSALHFTGARSRSASRLNYREWSGYYTVSSYETHHEHEYNAIRNAAALIDISPLFKHLVSGRDAARLVDRVITRDVSRMDVGRVFYTPWCDEEGYVIDDGTVARLSETTFRITSADPTLRWLTQNARGFDATVGDVSEHIAALAAQGPRSADVLRACSSVEIDRLNIFVTGTIRGVPVDISRTGYTGDLGYEVWLEASAAVDVWDALMTAGEAVDIKPAGMLALDVARVEAGLVLADVDYVGSRKRSPGRRATRHPKWGWAGWWTSRRARSSARRRWLTSARGARSGRSWGWK